MSVIGGCNTIDFYQVVWGENSEGRHYLCIEIIKMPFLQIQDFQSPNGCFQK